jgi:hypothetical protein
MTDAIFKDDDASVYKNHILYYLPDDSNCSRLVGALDQHPLGDDVYMQDVRQLRQRPAWLDGVPILVRRKDGQAHKGQNIYNYLRSWQPEEDDFQPAGASTGGYASYEDGETAFVGERKFASLFSDGMFNVEDDAEDGGGRGGGGGGMRAAASTVDSFASNGSQKPLNEKQRRKQEAEVESSHRAQQMLDARQMQDQRLQQRPGGPGGGGPGGAGPGQPRAPVPRNAFSSHVGGAAEDQYSPQYPQRAQPQQFQQQFPATRAPMQPPPPQQQQQYPPQAHGQAQGYYPQSYAPAPPAPQAHYAYQQQPQYAQPQYAPQPPQGAVYYQPQHQPQYPSSGYGYGGAPGAGPGPGPGPGRQPYA